MSLHSDKLFWFWANQYLLFLLNAVCLVEKQQIPILNTYQTPLPIFNFDSLNTYQTPFQYLMDQTDMFDDVLIIQSKFGGVMVNVLAY
jgi:hypothetical protein